jgi:2-amino-4-hydroxy-6-hydroxymethyldihydropteridine diphosphokinase
MIRMIQVFVGLGSNLGDRMDYLKQALAQLLSIQQTTVKRWSSVYETDPVGNTEQPVFLNMVAELESSLPPVELLHRLKETERSLGRIHRDRWGPREIDLDLLYYDDEVYNDAELHLPHPEIANRRFVLVPMKEIAAEFCDSLHHLTMNALLHRCPDTSAVRKISQPITLQQKG